MKSNKILSYIFGTIFLMMGIMLLSYDRVQDIMSGISFLFIAILLFPIFDYLCKLANRRFSKGKKVGLGISTFLVGPLLFSSSEITYIHIFPYVIAVLFLWVIMFLTTKDQYVNVETRKLIEESNKNGFFSKIYNSIIKKRNKKVKAVIDYENEIKENFYDLDIMTLNAIAKMISETRERHNSVLNVDMPELSISELVMAFCKDSQQIEDEYVLNNLYTPEYYRNIINKHCYKLVDYIKTKIKESLNSQNRNRYVDVYNQYLKVLIEGMSGIAGIKFYKTIYESLDDRGAVDRIFEQVSANYKDAFYYLVDMLATCTCISKMIFVERKVKQLDKNHEFYKIISNMVKEFKDSSVVIEKSRPVYDEFYKTSLGFIDDELLYSMAVTTMKNRMNSEKVLKNYASILNIQQEKIGDIDTLDNHIREWISDVASKHKNLEFDSYILFKITKTIDISNFDLLLEALGRTNEYIKLYNHKVAHNNKVLDKERYLKGDFEKEKIELSGKYTLNNITTGTQFEIYLVNLFRDLGYKAKHIGKAGDQGADLILKKGDYVYAVQAKYYTGKLGNSPVQEIAGALKYYNANQGVVVTNSDFTPGAIELAKANNVILIDGKKLKKLSDFIFEDNHDEDVLKKFE